MHHAGVIGFVVKPWGPYPALLDGKPTRSVHGMAYEMFSQTKLDRLAAYATNKYPSIPCLIELMNDSNSIENTIEGAFIWDGQQDDHGNV